MTDLERRIRDLLDEDARSAPQPAEAARAVSRTRRRQAVTLAGSALGVVALVAASIVAVRAVLTTDGMSPADAPTVTTTMNGISITYPEGWHVIDPDEAGLNGPDRTGARLPPDRSRALAGRHWGVVRLPGHSRRHDAGVPHDRPGGTARALPVLT